MRRSRLRVAAAAKRARPFELGLGGLRRGRPAPRRCAATRRSRAARRCAPRGCAPRRAAAPDAASGCRAAASTNCCAAAVLSPRASARNAAPSCGAASPRTRETMPSTSAMLGALVARRAQQRARGVESSFVQRDEPAASDESASAPAARSASRAAGRSPARTHALASSRAMRTCCPGARYLSYFATSALARRRRDRAPRAPRRGAADSRAPHAPDRDATSLIGARVSTSAGDAGAQRRRRGLERELWRAPHAHAPPSSASRARPYRSSVIARSPNSSHTVADAVSAGSARSASQAACGWPHAISSSASARRAPAFRRRRDEDAAQRGPHARRGAGASAVRRRATRDAASFASARRHALALGSHSPIAARSCAVSYCRSRAVPSATRRPLDDAVRRRRAGRAG